VKTSNPEPVKNQSDIAAAEMPILLDSQQQPAWHVVVLSFFTLGAYNMFWLYRNLRDLCCVSQQLQASIQSENKASPSAVKSDVESSGLPATTTETDYDSDKTLTPEELEDIHIRLGRAGTLDPFIQFAQARPIFTTALFAIPVVNLLVLLGFGHMCAKLIPDSESFARKNSQFSGFVLALLFGALTLLIRLPEPFQLLYLTSAIPLAVVQIWLNRHWKTVEDNKRLARQAFNPLELVAIVSGAALIGLIAIHPDIHGILH
jgi:hypothetical protein